MDVVVATEARFRRGPDGHLRSDTGGRAYAFWSRYLEVFDSVIVLARVNDVNDKQGDIVSGKNVSVFELPGYRGVGEATSHAYRIHRLVKQLVERPATSFIARVPGIVPSILTWQAWRLRRPFALEVVGDPHQVIASGPFRGILGMGLKWLVFLMMRFQCKTAVAVSYVTNETLQRIYPPGRRAVVASYSSVELPDEAFVASYTPRRGSTTTLVTVGTQEQMYKGHDVLIRAMSRIDDHGRSVALRLVGSGQYQPALRRLAREMRVEHIVEFVGYVPTGAGVRAELDRADIFVLPSRTEGLPRALIEAMARGLPCLASNAGGIGELLDEEDIVDPCTAENLALAVQAMLSSPQRKARSAERNLRRVELFHRDQLAGRRRCYYEAVKQLSVASRCASRSTPAEGP